MAEPLPDGQAVNVPSLPTDDASPPPSERIVTILKDLETALSEENVDRTMKTLDELLVLLPPMGPSSLGGELGQNLIYTVVGALQKRWRLSADLCAKVLKVTTSIVPNMMCPLAVESNLFVGAAVWEVFFESSNQDCLEAAATCLSSVFPISLDLRADLIAHGVVRLVATRLLSADSRASYRRELAHLGVAICKSRPLPAIDVVHPLLEAAATCVSWGTLENHSVLVLSFWMLSHFASGQSNGRIAAVLATGVLPRVCSPKFLESCPPTVLIAIVRLAGNVAGGSDAQVGELLESNCLPLFAKALSSEHEDLRSEACWGLSNVVGSSSALLEIVVADGILDQVVEMMASSPTSRCMREAVHVFSNFAECASPELLHSCMTRIPLVQLLVFCFFELEPRRNVAYEGLRSTFRSTPLSLCVQVIRNQASQPFRLSFSPDWTSTVFQDSMFRESEFNKMLWLCLAMGAPDQLRLEDGSVKDLFAPFFSNLPRRFHRWVHGFRSISALLSLTSPSRSTMGKGTIKQIWLPVDCWRLVWHCIFSPEEWDRGPTIEDLLHMGSN